MSNDYKDDSGQIWCGKHRRPLDATSSCSWCAAEGEKPAQTSNAETLCGCGYRRSLHLVTESDLGGGYCDLAAARHRANVADHGRDALRGERDDWKLSFEASNERVGKLETENLTLREALTRCDGLLTLWHNAGMSAAPGVISVHKQVQAALGSSS